MISKIYEEVLSMNPESIDTILHEINSTRIQQLLEREELVGECEDQSIMIERNSIDRHIIKEEYLAIKIISIEKMSDSEILVKFSFLDSDQGKISEWDYICNLNSDHHKKHGFVLFKHEFRISPRMVEIDSGFFLITFDLLYKTFK